MNYYLNNINTVVVTCDYSDKYILDLIDIQLKTFKITEDDICEIQNILPEVKKRIQFNFSHSTNKYYFREKNVLFNPFHSGQWTIFLYYLSNSLFAQGERNRTLCDKLYYLNRMLNSCDLFYEVELPHIFSLDHPLGTVIGRGKFENYFSFSQGCTIGNNKGVYPSIGSHVTMLSNSKIIGSSIVGNNVIVAANAYIKDCDIPDDSIVFGQSPNLIIKEKLLPK